jgi:hypothetical protein
MTGPKEGSSSINASQQHRDANKNHGSGALGVRHITPDRRAVCSCLREFKRSPVGCGEQREPHRPRRFRCMALSGSRANDAVRLWLTASYEVASFLPAERCLAVSSCLWEVKRSPVGYGEQREPHRSRCFRCIALSGSRTNDAVRLWLTASYDVASFLPAGRCSAVSSCLRQFKRSPVGCGEQREPHRLRCFRCIALSGSRKNDAVRLWLTASYELSWSPARRACLTTPGARAVPGPGDAILRPYCRPSGSGRSRHRPTIRRS